MALRPQFQVAIILAGRRKTSRKIALGGTAPGRLPHPPMEFIGDGGLRFSVPFAPLPVEHGARARKWEEVERSGRTPLLTAGGLPLPTQSFTLTLARPDHQQPVEDYINNLVRAAESTQRFGVSYGPLERGLWRITDLRVTVTGRQHGTNLATRATAQLTLTGAGPSLRVGPVTGGVAVPPAAPPARRTYQVKRGDTLWAIAVRFYGNGRRWPEIADANAIRDPRKMPTFAQSGKALVIP